VDVNRLLESREALVLDEALAAMRRARLGHYETLGAEVVRARLEALYDAVREAVRTRHLAPIEDLGEKIAIERHGGGYSLAEVQTAFNVLEEVVWRRILSRMEPSQLAEAIGLTSTILGIGKDALARKYVALATKGKVSSLDLKSLFAGT
jgi:hypothetical protein